MNRILQVCNTDFYLDRFLAPLVVALHDKGFEVECLTNGPHRPKSFLDRGIRVHAFSFPQAGNPATFLKCIDEMRAFLRENRYDCVNSHNRNASIVARVAAWLENVPLNIYTAHGYYFHDDQSRLAREATILLEGLLAKTSDYTLSQSGDDAALMIARGWVEPTSIETIWNGISTKRFSRIGDRTALESDLALSSDVFRVCAVGRLVKGKGFQDLLEAFARLHQKNARTELLMIGGNIAQDITPFQEEFVALQKEHGLGAAVKITGLTTRVEDYLRVSDVFVHPSYREGMPRSLLEAMACELPAIASRIRGCKEIVRHGENGWIYDPHDIPSLTRWLEHVAGMSPEERAKIGKNARETVTSRFEEPDYLARQVDAITRLLKKVKATKPSLGKRLAGFSRSLVPTIGR